MSILALGVEYSSVRRAVAALIPGGRLHSTSIVKHVVREGIERSRAAGRRDLRGDVDHESIVAGYMADHKPILDIE
ncbi:hypothetical protein CH256_16785 [Rhodococcus sp. 05-2254-6]|nr:hypothetical protein CH256_16785 [Rhodococcus sp. 05-2254-6]OZE89191.1 hypothetical protein CH302_29370 [Rhodococcus sp. 15-2388-1-1a]